MLDFPRWKYVLVTVLLLATGIKLIYDALTH